MRTIWRYFSTKTAGIVRFFAKIIEDLLVLCGIIIVIWVNFTVHSLLGWYSLAVVLIGLGLLIAIRRGRQHGGQR
jgi:hypothetical protein